MKETFGGIAQNLAGPVGLVAGLYQAGRALEEFARGRVQMQFFANDLGLSVQATARMKSALKDLGYEGGEANAIVSKLVGSRHQRFIRRLTALVELRHLLPKFCEADRAASANLYRSTV
jgi:hypothetical protein